MKDRDVRTRMAGNFAFYRTRSLSRRPSDNRRRRAAVGSVFNKYWATRYDHILSSFDLSRLASVEVTRRQVVEHGGFRSVKCQGITETGFAGPYGIFEISLGAGNFFCQIETNLRI